MAQTTGGGPSLESTSTRNQKALEKVLGPLLTQGLRQGAAPLDTDLFSEEEEKYFAQLQTQVGELAGRLKELGLDEAFRTQLSGKPSTEIDESATQEFFEKSIAAPLRKEFAKNILPGIRRSFRGFSSAGARAEAQGFSDLGAALASEYGKLRIADEQARRQLIENALGRQANIIPQAQAFGQLGLQNTALLGTIAESRQARRLTESARLRPENNPFFTQAQTYLGQNLTQFIDKPAGLTGFGTALQAVSGFKSAFGPPPGTEKAAAVALV